jgi:NTP pyrophosphatase (non-canonical NTP hydrolase)
VQDSLWGKQNHSADRWMTILVEEVGEVAAEIQAGEWPSMILELEQCAAVILAWLEALEDYETSST